VSQNAFVLGTNAKLNGFVGNVSVYYERMFRLFAGLSTYFLDFGWVMSMGEGAVDRDFSKSGCLLSIESCGGISAESGTSQASKSSLVFVWGTSHTVTNFWCNFFAGGC
jgi:hypothetical protein